MWRSHFVREFADPTGESMFRSGSPLGAISVLKLMTLHSNSATLAEQSVDVSMREMDLVIVMPWVQSLASVSLSR